ncbi:MAG: UDP-glucose 4-epimerase GalE [Gammaproteobacteria bacterium]|nr:UDP-glucose 4-epimerase GalE [Gammaproteobacteria bacterium]
MRILVTGALGYIGSHFCFRALEQGHELLLIDNAVSDVSKVILDAIIKHAEKPDRVQFFHIDVRDKEVLRLFFKENKKIDSVVHFAALKNASGSLAVPFEYYDNNLSGSLNVFELAYQAGIHRVVFSSTAAVYSPNAKQPCLESSEIKPATPYGKSKHMAETMLSDSVFAYPKLRAVALRYFNVAGAHDSGALTSVLLADKDMSLLSAILKVARGQKEYLSVYGNDYETRDGTAIRDYIHVLDIVDAHLEALNFMNKHEGFHVFNLGNGEGYTVLEMVKRFEAVNGVKIPMQNEARRPGDLMEVYADATRALSELGWKPTRDLDRMVGDVWV